MKKLALITIFILLLASFVTAVSLRRSNLEEATYDKSIEILSAGCIWESDHFNACAYVRWFDDVGDYAKVQISGGQPLANSPKQSSSLFSYCQDVGPLEGKHAIQAHLLSLGGSFKASDTSSVECKKSKSTRVTFEKNFTFRAESINSRAKSSGTFHISGLPGTPVSCDFIGNWVTDNRVRAVGTRLYCDKAGGQFTGHADLSQQYSTEDSSPFNWRQKGIFDPPVHTDQNYFFSAKTCDSMRYDKDSNYVRAYVSNFEKDGLLINWDYFNGDTKPAIDVFFTIKCTVIPEKIKQEPTDKKTAESQKDFFNQPEVTKSKPPGSASGITIETSKPTIWRAIEGWFKKVFLK